MKNWKSIQITQEKSVLEAIGVIDSTDARVALVVDSENKLLGTITDGDIRRGILNGVKLDNNVSSVLNKEPVVGKVGEDESNYMAMLETHQIKQLPLVNLEGVLSGFFFPADLDEKALKNPVVLMVGGLGTRLGDLTTHCPKPMLRVGGRPILETIINNFKGEGFKSFFLAVNYKSEVIENYFGDGSEFGINIEYLREKKRMGTAGSLGLIKDEIKEPIIVMNGDLLTSINVSEMIKFHKDTGAVATMCVREYGYQLPFGVVIANGTDMVQILEKPTEKRFVNAGIYVIDPSVLDRIPEDEFYDMPNLFNALIAEEKKVSVFPIREYWLDIGRREDFDRAHLEYGEIFE